MTSERPTYHELARRWKALRATHDVRVREVACVGAPRTLLCAELGDPALPIVTIAAGVHGDEPAGALALLALVVDRALDPRFSYRLWPCTNPTGFDLGTRTSADGTDLNRTFGRGGSSPEARAIVTANRDRRYALALDLHEDDEAEGFYCYAYGDGGIGEAIVDAVRAAGAPCDPRGCLRPDPHAEAEALGGLSLSLLLRRNAAERTLTLESPSQRDLSERIATHVVAVRAALSQTTVK
ncbi:MAG: succinylglutamate desuccinylase/aspartoacylase family protein [bacterium]|nr:succinylglutamate desuccinylase/aspartoacylase family protein [bacterium]